MTNENILIIYSVLITTFVTIYFFVKYVVKSEIKNISKSKNIPRYMNYISRKAEKTCLSCRYVDSTNRCNECLKINDKGLLYENYER